MKPRDKKLDEVVNVLKKKFKPKRLFLFGSRALGTQRADSDYDFVIVVDKAPKSRVDYMVEADDVLDELDIEADVFVYSQKEFDEWKNELSSIPETALNTGVEMDLE